MRRPLLLAALTMTTACSSPSPDPDLPAHDTPLASRLRALAVERPLVVGHRGASAEFPENTLPAFRAAVDQRSDMVELDFHAAADGVLVCLHDETLDRTTDARNRLGQEDIVVADTPWSTLSTLDAGSWKGEDHATTRIPTLAAALDTICAGSIPMVEHKAGPAAELVAVLTRSGHRSDALVQSFDWDWLREVRRLAPDLTLAALGSGDLTEARLAALDALGVSMVHWSHRDLRSEDIDALRARGYLVCVYTVDDPEWLASVAERNLDAVTTNVPSVAVRALGERPGG